MAMTSQQEIPNAPKEQTPWTTRSLFPVKAAVKALTRVFVTPYDFLLLALIIAVVIVEVVKDGSLLLFILAESVLFVSIFDRHISRLHKDLPATPNVE